MPQKYWTKKKVPQNTRESQGTQLYDCTTQEDQKTQESNHISSNLRKEKSQNSKERPIDLLVSFHGRK